MSKKKNYYFGKEEEEAVVKFINEEDWDKKNKIFDKYLREPFRIMKEAILRKYPIHIGNYEMEEVESDALSHLIEQINKFNPDMITKSGKKTRAYSYCQTIIRNYYRDHGKKTYLDKKVNLPYHDYSEEIQNDNQFSYEMDYNQNDEIIKLINLIVCEIQKTIDKGNLKDNEIAVGEAIINILQNWDWLFMENSPSGRYDKVVTNKFQKSKIFLYLKEYTRLSSKEIREALKVYKTLYFSKKTDFFSEE
jgi:hypothetical protein